MFYYEFRWFDREFFSVRTLMWIKGFLCFYVTSRFSCFKELLVLGSGRGGRGEGVKKTKKKRGKVLVFALLIYLQRVRSGPSSHVSHLLLQNEVSKYISAPCTRSHPPPLASLCFVLSYLFITAYIWLRCNFFFFFFDFCSFNICSLPVANRGAIIYFHGATETFDILI